MSLTGSTAIVTGGAIRIGRSIATVLAQAGADVCIQYRSSDNEAMDAVSELQALGVQATAVQADFSQPMEAARRIMQHVQQHHRTANILVNSAAIFDPGTLRDTTVENWDAHLTINLKGPFFLTQVFVDQLGDARGDIINIVDWRGTRPVPGHIAYTIAKSGLVAQTKILAQELGPNVKVNAIAPGAILPAPNSDPQVFEKRGKENPLKCVGSPEEIANTALFAIQSQFMTGEVLHITGGEQLGIRK